MWDLPPEEDINGGMKGYEASYTGRKHSLYPAAGRYLTAEPGVATLISARIHIFVEIDHEIISTVILLPTTDSRSVVVSYKQKYVQEVLVNCLVKLAQEKKYG